MLTTVHRVGDIFDCPLFLHWGTNCVLLFKEISNKGWNSGTLSLDSIVKESEEEQNLKMTHHTHFSPIHGESHNLVGQSFHLRRDFMRWCARKPRWDEGQDGENIDKASTWQEKWGTQSDAFVGTGNTRVVNRFNIVSIHCFHGNRDRQPELL